MMICVWCARFGVKLRPPVFCTIRDVVVYEWLSSIVVLTVWNHGLSGGIFNTLSCDKLLIVCHVLVFICRSEGLHLWHLM